MEESWNAKTCLSQDWGTLISNQTENGSVNTLQCPPIWDGFSCWGPTSAGTTASSRCPSFKGSDITKSSFRICSPSGEWLDRDGIPSPTGWTNYTPCLTPEIREIMRRLGSNDDAQIKFNIAENTRILEFVGLSLSLGALLLSLLIFYYFRTLRNSRTRLHRHLFIAMVIQVGIRLIVYTDQAITRSFEPEANANGSYSSSYNSNGAGDNSMNPRRGLDNTPILCEASYISLEYARTAMFMWMFVEGLFLHNMITVTVFEEKLSPLVYPVIGWILPIPLTVAWAVVTHLHYGTATCWWGYNFTLYFWILEGPRLAVLMVNLAFLLNILRVLVMKLRQSNSSETQQAMKAVKAALVLLPLLGLTNLLNMVNAPLEKSPLQFALWSYTTHLLTSTQGLILAFLYCFRNGEVQIAVRKFVRIRILGNSKHIILNKKPIPLSAMDNGSLYNGGDDSVNSVNGSQTVNMINPPTTVQESAMILLPNGTASTTATTTFNGGHPSNYYNHNGNNNNRRAQIGKITNFKNNHNKGAVSSPTGDAPPLAPLIVRSFSNGVLKKTEISRSSGENRQLLQNNNKNVTHNQQPFNRNSPSSPPERHHLLHRNSSGFSDDFNGKKPLLHSHLHQNHHHHHQPSDNFPVTMTASSSFQHEPSNPITAPMTSSSSWCSSTSSTSSNRNKELHPHPNQLSTPTSPLEFQSHFNHHQPNNSCKNLSEKLIPVPLQQQQQQIANNSSWRMLIIPEQLLKRFRSGGGSGGTQQSSDIESASKLQPALSSDIMMTNSCGKMSSKKQKKLRTISGSGSTAAYGADGIVIKEEEYEQDDDDDHEISNSTGSSGDGVSMDFYAIDMTQMNPSCTVGVEIEDESVGMTGKIFDRTKTNNKNNALIKGILGGVGGVSNNNNVKRVVEAVIDNEDDGDEVDDEEESTVQIEIMRI